MSILRRIIYMSVGIALLLFFVSQNVTPADIQPRRNVPLIDQIIREYGSHVGGESLEAAVPYKNHCYRAFNFALRAFPRELSQREEDIIAIALGFHYFGVWTDKTLDYLAPSEALASTWMKQKGYSDVEIEQVRLMIEFHLKITKYEGPHDELVERVRHGEWVDLTLGMLTFNLKPSEIRTIRETFPAGGFFLNLAKTELWWLSSHPLNPAPFLRY